MFPHQRRAVTEEDLPTLPPIVEYIGGGGEPRPAMLLAWKRDVLLEGLWWGLLAWLATEQLPFGDPEYAMVTRWSSSDSDFRPIEGQDYSRVPMVAD